MLLLFAACYSLLAFSQQDVEVKKKDRKRDIELVTTEGRIILRLSDSTPEHRDNFIRLVKGFITTAKYKTNCMKIYKCASVFMLESVLAGLSKSV